MKNFLEIKNVNKHYVNESNVSKGIDNISLSFNLNEFVCLTGSSGSGKTTLLNIIGGLATPDEGEITLNGEFVDYLQKQSLDDYRRQNISFIFQEYKLLSSLTVLENVLVPFEFKKCSIHEAKRIAKDIIERVGLAHRMHKRVSTLSGGEQQRVVIARALARNSKIIICDEPTGNLDKQTGQDIIKLLKEIAKDKLVIFVTHNEAELQEVATRKIVLNDGSVLSDDSYNNITQTDNPSNEAPIDLKLTKTTKHNNLLRLIFKYFFSNSKLAALMIFVFFVFGFLLLMSISFVSLNNERIFDDPLTTGVIDTNLRKVKKLDGSILSSDEFINIKNKTKSEILSYGYLRNESFNIKSNSDSLPSRMVFFAEDEFTSLTVAKGEKIKKATDCYFVVSNPNSSLSSIGKTFTFNNKNDYSYNGGLLTEFVPDINFTIVGLISKNTLPKNFDASKEDFMICSKEFYSTYSSYFPVKYLLNHYVNFKINHNDVLNPSNPTVHTSVSLSQGSYNRLKFAVDTNKDHKNTITYFDYSKASESHLTINSDNLISIEVDIRKQSRYYKGLSFNLDPQKHTLEVLSKSEALALGQQIDESISETNLYEICIITQDIYEELLNQLINRQGYFSSNKPLEKFLSLINDNPDGAKYGVSLYVDPSQDREHLASFVNYIFLFIKTTVVLISFSIYAIIISLIFKRIFAVKQKDYNILRTLGASRKHILTFIFVENIIVMHLSYIVFVTLSIVLKYSLKSIPFISDLFNFKALGLIVFYILLLLIALYSSLKYITKLYKKEIAKSLSKGGSKK